MSSLSREKRCSRTVTVAELGIKRGQPLWIRELSTAGSTACQQTVSTPEEQMTMAVQQLYVRLQQLQRTLAILRPARNELVKQVQGATSTTTLRSYLGAVDQRNKPEPTTTEESSTPRLNMTLSTQVYKILVMTNTLYRCRKCRCERGIRRMEAVRERVGAKVCWTPEERVVLPTLRRHTDTATSG